MIAPQRLAVAAALSVAAHGAALGALERLSGGLAHAGAARTDFSAPLRARLEGPASAVSVPAAAPRQTATAKRRSKARAAPDPYYPAHLLDERPLIRVHVEPAFPAFTRVRQARVTLRLRIAEDGRVDEVTVLDSPGEPGFAAEAARAFAAARFTPGKLRGKAVKSALTIEVLFGSPVPL